VTPDKHGTSSARTKEFVGLDLLRFLAASLVMMFHLCYWSWADPGSRTNSIFRLHERYDSLRDIASAGWVGVEVFFVISGVVIAWSAQKATAAGFLRSRFLRLAPAAWICATFCLLIAVLVPGVRPPDLVKPYLHSMSFYPTAPWMDDVYWTLDVECAFYGVVAAVLLAKALDHLEVVVGVLGLLSAAFWLAYWMTSWSPSALSYELARVGSSRFSELLLLQHGCLFSLGVSLFVLSVQRKPSALGALFILGGLLGGCLEILASASNKDVTVQMKTSHLLPIALWLSAVAFVVFSVCCNEWLARALRHIPMRRVGLVTYPLYLLSNFVGLTVLSKLGQAHIWPGAALLLAITAALCCAWTVSEYLEPVLRRRLKHMLETRRIKACSEIQSASH
jgi:peptidoglycan/LPS O-acetylase OafA/YrhL